MNWFASSQREGVVEVSIEEDDDAKIRRNLLVFAGAIVGMRFLGIKQEFFVLLLRGLSDDVGRAADGIPPWKFTALASLVLIYFVHRFWHTKTAAAHRSQLRRWTSELIEVVLDKYIHFSVGELGEPLAWPKSIRKEVDLAIAELRSAVPAGHVAPEVTYEYATRVHQEPRRWMRPYVSLDVERSLKDIPPKAGGAVAIQARRIAVRLTKWDWMIVRARTLVLREMRVSVSGGVSLYRVPMLLAACAGCILVERAVALLFS